MGPDAEKDGRNALFFQVGQSKITPQATAGMHLDAQSQDVIDLPVQHLGRQAVVGNAGPQHAAQPVQCFIKDDLESFQTHVVGDCKAGRAAADHGDFLRSFVDRWHGPPHQRHLVGRKPFQCPDRHRCIHLGAAALGFTRVGADAAQGAGQGQLFHDQGYGLFVFALGDELDISLHIDPGRTGARTGSGIALFDLKCDGHRLGKRAADGPALAQALVPVIGDRHRTHFGALAATGADPLLDIPRVLMDRDAEVAHETRYIGHLAERMQPDVGMLPHVDHLGCANARRAVQGGEGLVELQHVAADGGSGLDQVHRVAGVGHVQGRLHAGDAGTDHHHHRVHLGPAALQGFVAPHAMHGGRHQGLGLGRGEDGVLGDPGDLLAHRGHLEIIGVQARAAAHIHEGGAVQAR